MSVHQYDPLLAPLKEQGVFLDYLYRSSSNWPAAGDPPVQHFEVLVASNANVAEVERKIADAVAGHPYRVTVKREVDLNFMTESDDDLNDADHRIVIQVHSDRGKDWMDAYTRDVKPHPLDCREVPSGRGYVRQWVQSDTSNIEYLEIMLDEARDFGLNVTGNLPKS